MTTQPHDRSPGIAPADTPSAAEAAETGATGGGGFIALLALTNLGVWFAFFTPFIFTLQLKVQLLAPENPGGALAVVVGATSIFGLVANPFAGRLSDRTTSRFGMRRPWLLGATVLGVIGLVIMGLSTDLIGLS
ncbi:MFS transporter, partial [uncultured Amnibacterium sp.]|uniref:MFS transporter n=1 Tax=uncultured Amnibacterium sp. TaxID=1631851 RepID=UPI0035CC5BD8